MKKIITIVSLFIVCSLGVGCSQYAKVETEPASIMVPLSESTEPSKEEPSAESGKVTTGSSEPQAEDQAGSTRTEKKEIINNLKKQAEDEAEQDRHFILEALGDEGADGRWSEACGFIQDQYPDYFSSDELLKRVSSMVITSLPFTACSKEDYPRDSLFLEDPGSPFQAQDYDAIYLYQFGRIPEEAVKENSIITGGRISITALVKDGIVISVFTNIPVAG